MIGMDFMSFIILLVIGIVISAVLHFGVNYHHQRWWLEKAPERCDDEPLFS